MKLAVLIANRGFFPSSVIESARQEMVEAVRKAGAEVLMPDTDLTKYGAVETREEGEAYASFLEQHYGEYAGLIICLPNFGDDKFADLRLHPNDRGFDCYFQNLYEQIADSCEIRRTMIR